MLNGHLTALNPFISRSTDKCKPLCQALKKNGADFHWNEEWETTFQGLKRYLASPPPLSKPSSGETLYLYLCQLFHERPPNKIPEARKANASPLNHLEEAQALLLNLPDHSHHRVSPTKHREKSQSNRKDIKMASELRSYGLRCEPRIVIKGQVLADFIADFTSRTMEHANQLGGWILNIDGASNSKGVGIGIVLTTPEGSIIEQSFTLSFPASNNETEYEVVLAGLRATITLGVTRLEVLCDSLLVVNQVSGEYVTRD